VDTEIDKRLEKIGGPALALRGKAAIANAQLAYTAFRDLVQSTRWAKLKAKGARPQRVLWASTGAKNPAYSDVIYVDGLIAPETVNTLPPATLTHFEDHGTPTRTLSDDATQADQTLQAIEKAGVDLADVARFLEEDGVKKFAQSFDALLGVINTKRKSLTKQAPPRASAQLRAFDLKVAQRLDQLDAQSAVKRIWARDPFVWVKDPATPEIRDRLGWLTVGETMAAQADQLAAFADDVRKSFDRVVLLGMGGSSLAPEVLWRTFGRKKGFPSLFVLDTTDPRTVSAVEQDGDLARSLFIVASKSGTTQEPDAFFRYFWEKTGRNGRQFIAITDPKTPLVHLANQHRFRKGFANPPDIGGRYSALSYFGLVPAALIGVDVGTLLHRAHRMAEACGSFVPAFRNPAAWLGTIMGEAALGGRDKITFVLSPTISTFGLWAEQLIAESTGKNRTGVLPVADEPLGAPEVYGADRVFAYIALADEVERGVEDRLDALSAAGHPVVRLVLEDAYDLGGEFFRWELATAVAGAVIGIHPFDQPNVAESKANTKNVLEQKGKPSPATGRDDLEKFLGGIKPGDYLAIMAYLPYSAENDRRLNAIRKKLRDRLKVATTLGYGPRFLHSTGQLHKGGRPVGHFLQITQTVDRDVPIPGDPFTFGELESAQAEGDLQALRKRGRPAIRVEGLDLLEGL
jgi:transaldolase/glucose-6-phosphate isomerase